MERRSGVLMNISSLPSPFAIGVFGREAEGFAASIKEMGFSEWQILPLNTVGAGESPYSSDGAFSGNIMYIDPLTLMEDGYVTEQDVQMCIYNGSPYSVDYGFAMQAITRLMKTAYASMTDECKKDVERFLKDKEAFNYAYYKALKEHFENKPFYEWDDEFRNYKKALKHKKEFADSILFHGFCQYIFTKQWFALKEKINAKKVNIIGDMPIYVGLDSADVWAHTELFLIDPDTYRPNLVAGVPPDAFSEDGQLWGNPLFDWAEMEKNGFQWWIDRIKYSLKLYDTVRIDHFRGIASFWAVGADEKTARNGKWMKGPGMKLFKAVNAQIDSPSIIAEDLGVFGKDVVRLLKSTGFAGMRVIQFAFGGDDSVHLPHNYTENCVVYTGTHDNNTLLGWLYDTDPSSRDQALEYCKFSGDWGQGGEYSPSCRAIIDTIWSSCAGLVVIPVQDMCGYGSDTRMNCPGVAEGNWRPRFTSEQLSRIDREYFSKINRVYFRSFEKNNG